MQSEPLISEFIIEIRRFDEVELEIAEIPDSQVVGSLELEFSQSLVFYSFLQHVSIACYAERCISHDRFCPTV